MKTQTIFVADDGSRWGTPEKARTRDELVRKVAEAMAPLGEKYDFDGNCDYEKGHGYVQHDVEAVKTVTRALIELSRPFIGWFVSQLEKQGNGIDLTEAQPEWFVRELNNRPEGNPVQRAWQRMIFIDARGREWGQQSSARLLVCGSDGSKEFEVKRSE